MRDVSKAKFDGSLLVFALLERAVDDSVWLSMGTMRANLVRSPIPQIMRQGFEVDTEIFNREPWLI